MCHCISEKVVVTRKPWQCLACVRNFDSGTKCNVSTNIGDGNRIYDVRFCETCDLFRKQKYPWIVVYYEEFVEGEHSEEWEAFRAEREDGVKA